MPEGIDLGVSGLASNFDWRSLIDRLSEVERAPQRRLLSEQQAIENRRTAYGSIVTQLSVLQNRVNELSNPSLFDSRTATASDTTLATSLAAAGAALGSYAFHVSQRGTAAAQLGTANAAGPIHNSADVSGLLLGQTAFPTPITAGTFTVNGRQISIQTTDPLQAVFDRIAAATGGDVTGSYDPATDKITLASASHQEILLGSAADTSNFLLVTRLSNQGSWTTGSSAALGAVQLSSALADSNLATAITGDATNLGKFSLNGIEITYDTTLDSVQAILDRITASEAGVNASYDAVNDRFTLSNKTTGDVGMGLADVTGNFLAATGLLGGALQRGKDLQYTVNNGGTLSSHSNSITTDTSGIPGLTVAVLKEGDFTVEVAHDAEKARTAIKNFVDDYNKVQALIDTNTASSTDAKGKVTAGTLAGESEAYSLAAGLRRLVNGSFSFLTGAVQRIESLGITGNGDDNKLSLPSDGDLDKVLSAHPEEVKALFTTESTGLGAMLTDLLDRTVGTEGTLINKQDNLQKQSASIDDQILQQERQVQSNRDLMTQSFLAMETAQLQINQQLQFLAQRFGTSTK